METFSVKFRAGSLDLSAIVTEHDHHQKFKVEMVTNEPKPILLTRSVKGEWTVIERGLRNFSDHDFEALKLAIEEQLCEVYSMKNMLVLTDFSDSSSNAARYAADLSHQLKTEHVILYHSYESVAIPATAFAPVTGRLTDTHEQSLEKISKLKNELEQWVPEQTEVEARTDERTLISAVNALAKQHHLGLVVAGITGKSNIERVLVGSNTITLANHCQAPLLIVPPVAVFQPISTVVFACDLKRVAESTPVLAIKTFVRALGAKLLILNVDNDGEHFEPNMIREMTHLHEFWDNEKPEYHYIGHEDTVTGIMEFARLHDAELVIMVPRHYGFFEGIFHSSLTKKLAYHTHRPLLLFKEDT